MLSNFEDIFTTNSLSMKVYLQQQVLQYKLSRPKKMLLFLCFSDSFGKPWKNVFEVVFRFLSLSLPATCSKFPYLNKMTRCKGWKRGSIEEERTGRKINLTNFNVPVFSIFFSFKINVEIQFHLFFFYCTLNDSSDSSWKCYKVAEVCLERAEKQVIDKLTWIY